MCRRNFVKGESAEMEVGIHLKGRNGSFQRLGAKPSLSIKFDKFNPEGRFHGLKKIQLNNCAQDPTYLCEIICDDLFRAAGVPAKRGCHARVRLNGRDLGLYVLNEGFDKTFIKRHFGKAGGNLYDTGYRLDIDQPIERITGEDPNGDRMLNEAVLAARRPVSERLAALRETVNLDRFVSFIAMENIVVHWDGYAMFKNNYRVYADPERKRLEFFPHGMDLMFQRPDCSILPAWDGLIARGLMETAEGRRMYLERLGQLGTNVFIVKRIEERIHRLDQVIRPFFVEQGAIQSRDAVVNDLIGRIQERATNLRKQLQNPEKYRTGEHPSFRTQ
jgi:spore coat protein CotH